jgi:Putative polyhydroxyalkanoic acid system protein (PHA_gran_rgn)
MHLQLPHQLSKEQAISKVKKAIEEARPQMAAHQVALEETAWEGDTLRFALELQKHPITGTLEVGEKDFILDAKLPLVWRLFEGRIERAIAQQIAMLPK